GGKEEEAVALAVGLAPRVSTFDPKIMSMMALDEAVRGVIASGANPDHICLLDNFCWPNPLPANSDSPSQTLGELVRAGQGLADYARAMKMPFISGEASMKNDFKGKMDSGEAVHIRVLPTMLATALGRLDHIDHRCKTHARAGQKIYLLGQFDYANDFGFYPAHWQRNNENFDWDLNLTMSLYQKIHQAQVSKIIKACHDLSEGGLSVALFEMLLHNQCGIILDFTKIQDNRSSLLFSEFPARFIVAVDTSDALSFEQHFTHFARYLGSATDDGLIKL